MKALFSVERMIPRLRARDKRDVLRKLASASVHDAEVSETIVLGAATQAAGLPVFGPCEGIALPHAFIPGLRRPLAAVATLSPAVDFKAVDGSLTDLVVLLLSPAETASDHLRALARVARRLREPNVQAHLRAAECRESMYVLVVGSDSQADALDMERRSGLAV